MIEITDAITGEIVYLEGGLQSTAGAVLPIAIAALVAFVGFRLVAKLTNRGVGK